jgi:3-hydroxyisobutyrate dehydrogenase-like beta-hydroxyacid dehydrogenase
VKLGFIGLGRMGQEIAQRILDNGHELVVYNRTRSKAEALEKAGARVADSIAAACVGQDVVFTMLTDDMALHQVLDSGLLENLPKGAVHVPMGTHSVDALTEIDGIHKGAGQILVACPVLGRPDAVASGQAGLVPAGPQDSIAMLQPLFDAIGRRAFNAGTNPAGAAAVKLANNMVLGCAIEAMSEGFALTRKFGVDPAVFNEVLTEGLFAAPSYKAYGAIISTENYDQVGFTVWLGLKDANLALAAGQAANVPLPSCNVYRDRLLGAIAHGDGDRDWSVIAREQARACGLE